MKSKSICTALVFCIVALSMAHFAAALAEEADQPYVMNIIPKEMAGIAMNMNMSDKLHEIHTEALEDECTPCHYDDDYETFMGVSVYDSGMSEKARQDFVHKACVDCHVKMKTGPSITECRSCHTAEYGAL